MIMQANVIHPTNLVDVKITNTSGHEIYHYTGQGFRNVEQAIATAYSGLKGEGNTYAGRADASLEENPSFFHYYRNPDSGNNEIENYVFTVANLTLHTSARYRVNAGGHVKLLPELGNE